MRRAKWAEAAQNVLLVSQPSQPGSWDSTSWQAAGCHRALPWGSWLLSLP